MNPAIEKLKIRTSECAMFTAAKTPTARPHPERSWSVAILAFIWSFRSVLQGSAPLQGEWRLMHLF